jgi:hypothetical protein
VRLKLAIAVAAVRRHGRWLIARHKVFNEQRENMASGLANPAW